MAESFLGGSLLQIRLKFVRYDLDVDTSVLSKGLGRKGPQVVF